MNRTPAQSKYKGQVKPKVKSGGTVVHGPKAPKRRHG